MNRQHICQLPFLVTLGVAAILVTGAAAWPTQNQKKNGGSKTSQTKPPATTTQQKPPQTPPPPPQPPSEKAEFGTPYMLGLEKPFVVTLIGAELRAERLKIDDNVYFAREGEKILLIRFSIRNPRSTPIDVAEDSVQFNVLDSNGQEYDAIQDAAIDGTTKQLKIKLKPNESVTAVTAFIVPGRTPIDKVIIKSSEPDLPFVQAALIPKMKVLSAPYKDPDDETGRMAAVEILAERGKVYQCGRFDLKLENIQYTSRPISDEVPGDGQVYLVATFLGRNAGESSYAATFDSFEAHVRSKNDTRASRMERVLELTRDQAIIAAPAPGKEGRFRIYFLIPKDSLVESIAVREDKDCRWLVFSAVPPPGNGS